MKPTNACQLITYPDSLGGDLKSLRDILQRHFSGLFTGLHVLPFYPSSGDRGFAPLTYEEVDPVFGDWSDIEALAGEYELMADMMFNHISRRSTYFQDFLQRKDDSPWAELFIRYKDFWPGGEPTDEQLAKIYTRKPRPPYLETEFADGTVEKVWCTFDYEQIDLDLTSSVTRDLVSRFLRTLCERGARMIRLDAFAYATKQPDTNCFFIEPEVWELLDFARRTVEPYGSVLLPEVHEHYTMQQKIAEHGYYVYDFALPMLMLQALYDGSSRNLKHWLSVCPRHQFTTLDTHDGIGVVDVHDLLSDEELERTKENVYNKGANVKRIYNTAKYQNLDVYQINCTYYSALGEDDEAYLLARAVQFFTPGIPQVYYVGALAGRNDIELVEQTKQGRNINRHNYTLEEIREEVRRPVVQRLFELMRFRNSCGAFDGELELRESDDEHLELCWRGGGETAVLKADLSNRSFVIEHTGGEAGEETRVLRF
jgi:sucrose phosphorylase